MVPKYALLSNNNLEEIHNVALEILESTGMRVDSEEAIKIFKRGGATTDANNIVKFPSAMIQKALESCQPQLSVYHRNSDTKLTFGDGETKHTAGGWTSTVLDWETGKYRQAILSDMIESVKMCSALDEIDCFMAPLICSDISPSQVELYQYKIGVEYSDKPIILSISDIEVFEKIIHLAAMLAGGRKHLVEKPNIILNLGVMSPLFLPKELCEIIVAASRLGIPFCIYSSSTAGGTSPVTLSGTLAGNHAEILAAITLAKLINPDIDILYSNYSKSFDMQHSDVLAGNPEYGLLKAAAVQLGNYIGLPTCTGALMSDSPQLDIQTGIEIMGSSFLPILSGVDLSSGMGLLSKLMVFSLESLVIDAECIAYFNRILKGINCDTAHLSADIYRQVKPTGEFLTQKHTFDYFKSEQWYSRLFNRKSFSTWNAEGEETSLKNNVQNLIRKTLREYKSQSLPESFIKEFEKLKI